MNSQTWNQQPGDSPYLPNASWKATFYICVCWCFLFAGCQSVPQNFLSKATPPWKKLRGNEASTEAPMPSQYVFAWNPPGMVVDEDFVNQGNSTTRKIDLKKFAIAEEQETRTLKKVLASIYSLDRLNAMSSESLFRTMVFRRHGPLTEVYPLALVLRYKLGDRIVHHRDMIGLVDGELLGIKWINEDGLDEKIGADEINISVTGLVTQPGPVQISAEQSEDGDPAPSLIGFDVILETILGRDDSEIGELLATDSQGVLADWAIVTRIHTDEDSMLQGLQKIFVPNPLSEQYRLEQEALDGGPSFEDLGRLMIQDGDAVEMSRDF